MELNPSRHLMVVHAYYPIGEPRVQREAEALVERGIQVDVVCLRQVGEPPNAVVNRVNVYRLPVHRRKGHGVLRQLLEYLAFFTLAFFKVTRLHLRGRHAVVQVHNLPDFLVFAALIPRLRGAKILLDLHDLMPEFYASRFHTGMNSPAVRLVAWQERLACAFAHHVITVTEPWRQTLIARGVAPARCSVVMNTADTRLFSARRSAPRLCPGGFHLLYHGTLARRYGIDLILRALARLRVECPDLRLTIHGRGEFLDELLALAHDLGLEDCVTFSVEYMPMEDLPALIASADLGVVAYRRDIFTDGILPTKLMEYAALGVPAVAARTPAIAAYFDAEMVEFFTAEDVKDLAGRIAGLYADRARLQRLSVAIQSFNRRYNWPAQKAGYVALVQQLGGAGFKELWQEN